MSNFSKDQLSAFTKAHLIPPLAETSKERRAVSIFLATLCSVFEFGQTMLGTLGQRVGKYGKLECFTEVVLSKEDNESRPDGLITLTVGKRQWIALVEGKIGNSQLKNHQIKKYCALAKKYKIDALITISNQFAAIPEHHPLSLKKSETKRIQLFHWSWEFILTQANLLTEDKQILDKDQNYILSEMLRFFEHPSSGVKAFTSMNPEWRNLVVGVKSGAKLNQNSPEVINTAAHWHQAQRNLSLLLSKMLVRPVGVKLGLKYKKDPAKRLRDDCKVLAKDYRLISVLEIPDTASPLSVWVDIERRTIACSMRLEAPKDKSTTKGRVNWLLRQLPRENMEEIFIKAILPTSGVNPFKPLAEVREDPDILGHKRKYDIMPNWFEVILVRDLAGKFSGPKTFVDELNKVVPEFYGRIGENLKAWQPKPPQIKEEEKE
ncbi:MAG: hypothetical protein IIB64_02905 [Proteobacteria bacterium]|nr:hypothetical protein [Pseudomonadota bacterium]